METKQKHLHLPAYLDLNSGDVVRKVGFVFFLSWANFSVRRRNEKPVLVMLWGSL